MTAKTPLKRTGYSQNTAKKYVMDSAVVYRDLEYNETDGWVGHLIGATNGGVNINIEQVYRQPEVDGARHVKMKDHDLLETASANVVAKIKEITLEVLRMAVHGATRVSDELEAPEGYYVIESKRDVSEGDYIGNIAFVGRLSGSSKPMIVVIDNAFVTSSLPLETADNSEAVIEMVFEARADYEQLDQDVMPWRIFYPEAV